MHIDIVAAGWLLVKWFGANMIGSVTIPRATAHSGWFSLPGMDITGTMVIFCTEGT